MVYGNHNWNPRHDGQHGGFPQDAQLGQLELGRVFTERELLSGDKVCLIGKTLVRELFGNRYPIGEEIRVKNVPFKVIGVLSEKGANFLGADQDDILLAPWTTIKYRLSGASSGRRPPARIPSIRRRASRWPSGCPAASTPMRTESIEQIMVQAKSPDAIPRASDEITRLLRDRHHVTEDETDFRIYDNAEVSNIFKTRGRHALRRWGSSWPPFRWSWAAWAS